MNAGPFEVFRQHLSKTVLRAVEPTRGPWHNQNTWGDQFNDIFPQTEGRVVQVLPKLDHMYGPPAVHSVQLARGDETPTINADLRARVTYGCGGVNNSFDCDWVHGAQFSLVCNSVTVSAVSYRPIGGVGQPYQPGNGGLFLGASVSKGTIANGQWPLTFTEQRQFSPAVGGTFFDFPVRDFVRAVCVHYTPGNGTNSDPQVPSGQNVAFMANGFALASYDLQVFAGGRQVPVPGGCNLIRVGDLGTHPASSTYVVQWFLGL